MHLTSSPRSSYTLRVNSYVTPHIGIASIASFNASGLRLISGSAQRRTIAIANSPILEAGSSIFSPDSISFFNSAAGICFTISYAMFGGVTIFASPSRPNLRIATMAFLTTSGTRLYSSPKSMSSDSFAKRSMLWILRSSILWVSPVMTRR